LVDFRVPLSVRPYLKHIGLRTTVAFIIATLAAIQVTFHAYCSITNCNVIYILKSML